MKLPRESLENIPRENRRETKQLQEGLREKSSKALWEQHGENLLKIFRERTISLNSERKNLGSNLEQEGLPKGVPCGTQDELLVTPEEQRR